MLPRVGKLDCFHARIGIGLAALLAALACEGAPPAASAKARPGPRFVGPAPRRWTVRPDPPARGAGAAPAADHEAEVPVPPSFFGGEIVFSEPPGTFVAVGRNGGANDVREVWDLATNERVAELRGEIKVEKPYALSGDGESFAARVPWSKSVEVLATRTGDRVASITLTDDPKVLAFAGPDRLLVGAGDRSFRVWDLKAAKWLDSLAVPGPVDPKGVAISPGGKYAALATNEGRLLVFDLATGKLAGDASLPKVGNFNLGCKGLVFSPDGTELVGIFESWGYHLLNWDVNTGRLIARHKLDEKSGVKEPHFYEGRAIEWVAGKGGWLLFGTALVDPQTAQRVHTVASEGDGDKFGRRAFGSDRILVVSGDNQNRVIRSARLPIERIRSAAQIVRSGGSAADAILPPVKPADYTGARRVPAGTLASAWAAVPDPAPAPSGESARGSYPLQCKAGEVQRILFAGPSTAQAVVASLVGGVNTFDPSQDEGKPRRLERIDMASGESLGTMDLPAVSDAIAISPDGSRVLTIDTRDRQRLDAYDLAGQKHLAGWRPYAAKGTLDDKSILWADFLDAGRVLTVNRRGNLVLWTIPDCKASYVAEGVCEAAPLLSPGRKTLAAYLGGTFRILDAATGAAKGKAEMPAILASGKKDFKGAAFLLDGTTLAAYFNDSLLVRWDLRTGRVVTPFSAPLQPWAMSRNSPLEWCGPHHVLIDGRMLVDVDRRVHVWSYDQGLNGVAGPDGRHWYTGQAFPGKPEVLLAVALPEPAVGRAVAMADDPNIPAVLRVRGKVGLQLEFAGPPRTASAFRSELAEQFRAKLQAYAMTIDDASPVKLVVHVDDTDTGRKLLLLNMFPSLREKPLASQNIALHELACQVWMADPQGKIELSSKLRVAMVGFGIIHLPSGETDAEAYLRERQWDYFKTWVSGVGLPYFVARPRGGLVKLPGFTSLAASTR